MSMIGSVVCARTGAASVARKQRRDSISDKNSSLTPECAPEVPIDRFEIFATGLDHPECLAFDREGVLWAGGEAGQVYRIAQNRQVQTVANMGGFCGGVTWSPDDRELYVCNPAHGIVRVKRSGEWSVFASGLTCPNYGLFDKGGNYW